MDAPWDSIGQPHFCHTVMADIQPHSREINGIKCIISQPPDDLGADEVAYEYRFRHIHRYDHIPWAGTIVYGFSPLASRGIWRNVKHPITDITLHYLHTDITTKAEVRRISQVMTQVHRSPAKRHVTNGTIDMAGAEVCAQEALSEKGFYAEVIFKPAEADQWTAWFSETMQIWRSWR